MYRVDRNNFYKNEKKATIYTPDYVSEFLYDLLYPHVLIEDGFIIDPCVGKGSLLHPWKKNGYNVIGIDIEDQGFPNTLVKNYLAVKKEDISPQGGLRPEVLPGGMPFTPSREAGSRLRRFAGSAAQEKISLVIMNPPFNIDEKTKIYIKEHYGGRPLLPEVWFSKALELFGFDIPIVMFTPYGFRLNQTENSKRWKKFIDKEYPEIDAIVSLPKNVFENILFHSEILIFNLPELKGHYFVKNIHYEQQRFFTPQRQSAFA